MRVLSEMLPWLMFQAVLLQNWTHTDHFSPRTVRDWNSLPQEKVQAHTHSTFITRVSSLHFRINLFFLSLSLSLFFLSYASLYLSVYLLHPPTPSTYNGLLVNPECIKDEKGAAVRFEHWHRTQPPCILACTSAVSKCSHFWPRLFTLHLWRSITQHKVNSICHVGSLSTLLTDWNYSKC